MDSRKFNKLLNEKYFLLKDIAQKYNYSEELLDMITFIYLAFYMDFGKSCDFALYDLFNKVKIIYDYGTVEEIALKNHFGQMPSGSAAVTVFTPNLEVFQNSTLKQNPQTILLGTHVEEHLATPVLKLEMLTHETRHALMGYYHTNLLLNDDTYYMRSGLQETYYLKNKNGSEQISNKKIGTTLDEITNTYITEFLVNRIMSFKKYEIENNYLKGYLNSLKTSQSDGKYRAIGYNFEVRLLYPLLMNRMFIDFVNQHQFDGEIELIKDLVSNNTNLCDYYQFSELLDTIYLNNSRYFEAVKNNNVDFISQHAHDIHYAKSVVLDINKNLVKKR